MTAMTWTINMDFSSTAPVWNERLNAKNSFNPVPGSISPLCPCWNTQEINTHTAVWHCLRLFLCLALQIQHTYKHTWVFCGGPNISIYLSISTFIHPQIFSLWDMMTCKKTKWRIVLEAIWRFWQPVSLWGLFMLVKMWLYYKVPFDLLHYDRF